MTRVSGSSWNCLMAKPKVRKQQDGEDEGQGQSKRMWKV